jgi:hypothetical protein
VRLGEVRDYDFVDAISLLWRSRPRLRKFRIDQLAEDRTPCLQFTLDTQHRTRDISRLWPGKTYDTNASATYGSRDSNDGVVNIHSATMINGTQKTGCLAIVGHGSSGLE